MFFRIALYIGAAVCALTGSVGLWHGAGPAAIRDHPVNARATVTDAYIDGFGGDPTVDYTFEVNGVAYTGSGTGGDLGNGDVLGLRPGDLVAIQYAATDPSLSCTCDAPSAPSWRLPRGGGVDPINMALTLPLIGVAAFKVAGRARRRT
jgi:hypothetical protein